METQLSTACDDILPDGEWVTETVLHSLKQKKSYPNVRITAYLLVQVYASHLDTSALCLDNDALTTAANLAALRAWDEGFGLTDLDQVVFDAYLHDGIPILELRRSRSAIRVPVVERGFTLHQPYAGKWDIAKTQITE